MQKHNFHTHTRYSDGHDTPRQMIEEAVSRGFTALGFSDHSYAWFESYYSMSPEGTRRSFREIRALAEEYRGVIDVWCGIELDGESGIPTLDYDFILAAVHEMVRRGESCPIDSGEERQRELVRDLFGGSFVDFTKAYFENLTEHVMRNKTDIVAHIDLPTKYSICPEEDPRYRDAAREAVREIVRHCPLFELNTGAIARGLRTVPYPTPFLLDEIREAGGSVIINSDCHYRAKLTCWFDEAEDYLTAHGFKRYDNQRLNARISGVTIWR